MADATSPDAQHSDDASQKPAEKSRAELRKDERFLPLLQAILTGAFTNPAGRIDVVVGSAVEGAESVLRLLDAEDDDAKKEAQAQGGAPDISVQQDASQSGPGAGNPPAATVPPEAPKEPAPDVIVDPADKGGPGDAPPEGVKSPVPPVTPVGPKL